MAAGSSPITSEEELDLSTWPMRLRPSAVYVERLTKTPLCPKCGKRSTWTARKLYGMCPSCWRTWTRPSLDQALASVSVPASARIHDLRIGGFATANILAACKREFEAPAGREWDATLVLAVEARDTAHGQRSVPRSIPHDYHPFPKMDETGRVFCRRCPGYAEP